MGERSSNDSPSAPEVQAINANLRGPVLDAIARCVPELQKFERDELYERVMNTPALADLCFKVFRANPGEFGAVVVAANGAKITNDDQMLSCGRTIAQVIAMIVRAMTRRYLRATLDGGNAAASLRPVAGRAGLVKRLAQRLWLAEQKRSGGATKGGKSASIGDQVYRALRDFLLYEWQVILIPEYAQIPVALAGHVAPYIVAARDPAAVRALISAAAGPAPARDNAAKSEKARTVEVPADAHGWRQFQP